MRTFWTWGVAVVLLAIAGCGCSAGSSGAAQAGTTTSTSAAAPPTTTDPNYDFGQTVTITASGFRPRELVSSQGLAVTWINESGVAQTVQFDHFAVRSGRIPPGGRFVYRPRLPVSITYHSGLHPGLRGLLQVSSNQT